MANPGPLQADLEAASASDPLEADLKLEPAIDTTMPSRKSPLGLEDSDKDSCLSQGSNGLPDDEEDVQDDSAGLVWPVLLVVAILLSLAGHQLWPRNQTDASGIAVSQCSSKLECHFMLNLFFIDTNSR